MPDTTVNPLIVVPAYGRDYATAEEALAAWREGKDFRIADISSRYDGSYVSSREYSDPVKIRFSKLADFVFSNQAGTEPGEDTEYLD